MTVIRVLPQGTSGVYGVQNAATTALYSQALQNQKDTDSLKLQYQNALWEEKLQNTQLSTQLQYTQALAPYGITAGANGVVGASTLGMVPSALGYGGLGSGSIFGAYGGLGGMFSSLGGMLGMGGSTSGQANYTNQTGTPGASQSVSNANTYNTYSVGGQSGFGQGVWGGMSNMLGGLFGGW